MKNKALEELNKRKALRLKQLADDQNKLKDTKERLANLDLELAEAKRLLAENEKLKNDMHLREIEKLRKKPGAKRKWKGQLGYHLICAVNALTADGTTQGQATRDLVEWANFWSRPSNRKPRRIEAAKADPRWIRFKHLVGDHWEYLQSECCHQNPRALAVRYHNALKAWGPYFEQDRALDAAMERFRAMFVTKTNEGRAALP